MKIQKFNEWIKDFPELDKLWNKLPLIPKTLFEIQIDNYTKEKIVESKLCDSENFYCQDENKDKTCSEQCITCFSKSLYNQYLS